MLSFNNSDMFITIAFADTLYLDNIKSQQGHRDRLYLAFDADYRRGYSIIYCCFLQFLTHSIQIFLPISLMICSAKYVFIKIMVYQCVLPYLYTFTVNVLTVKLAWNISSHTFSNFQKWVFISQISCMFLSSRFMHITSQTLSMSPGMGAFLSCP